MRLDTSFIHGREKEASNLTHAGAVVAPLFDSVTYLSGNEQQWKEIRYSRLSNTPTQVSLMQKLAMIERAEASLVTSSGLSAITTSLLALIPSGGHLLAQAELYGGTYLFLRDHFPKLGRQVTFFPPNFSAKEISEIAKPETRGIYIETLSNPLLKIPDLIGISSLARTKGWISFIDNTFLSPVNYRPIEHGFDVVLHSATKYLNGHSDLVAGVASGSNVHIGKVQELLNYVGGCLEPRSCHLLTRSLKTLGVRVRAQNQTAMKVAKYLHAHAKVARVYYPGLASPSCSFFDGFGGMLSFEVNGSQSALIAGLETMQFASKAPSLGGTETLITIPARTSHLSLSMEERKKLGISETTVRLSVGLEDPEDLIEDLSILLDKCGN